MSPHVFSPATTLTRPADAGVGDPPVQAQSVAATAMSDVARIAAAAPMPLLYESENRCQVQKLDEEPEEHVVGLYLLDDQRHPGQPLQ
jgi:hypothetical protein